MTSHPGRARARAACCLLIVLSSPLMGPTRAAHWDSSVALPDAPFVVPLAQSQSADETGPEILTERSNNNRTSSINSAGLNQSVFKTPGAWGPLPALPVQGTVYAQPLYVEQVTMASDHRPHNAVFVATAQNNIYAFDADNFASLWTKQLGGNDQSKITINGNELGCNLLSGQEGIGTEATPVIDRKLGRMFVSYRLGNEDPTKAEQRLAAIDLSSGGVISTKVEPPAPPQNWPQWNRSRAGLLLVNGVVYVAFGSRCEDPGTPQFQGWVLAYDAQSLSRVGAFGPNSEAALDGAGIWQGSVGPAADENGDIYIMTGNRRLGSTCNPSPCDRAAPDVANRSESAIRLQTAIVHNAQGSVDRVDISVGDWFTPYRKIWLDQEDLDLGASGLVLIPGTPLLFGGGKEGLIYVLDRDNMGGLDPAFWTNDVYTCPANFNPCLTDNDTDATQPDDPAKDRVRQKFQAGKTQDPDVGSPKMRGHWPDWPHIHGAPAFARFTTFAAMYVWPEKDHLKSFRWRESGQFDTAPIESPLLAPFKPPNLMPGGMISVAVDPTTHDGGVVFASVYARSDGTDGILHAFDPVTLQELWSSAAYPFVKYVPPTIARKKVFLAATNEVVVFGVR